MGFNFSKNQQLALLCAIGLSFLGLAYGGMKSAKRPEVTGKAVTVTQKGKTSDVEVVTEPGSRSRAGAEAIVVHVAGRVKKPGVYTLNPGARVIDTVRMAGGPVKDADLNSVNLAARARDGEQVLIPSKQKGGASAPAAVPSEKGAAARAVGSSASPGHVVVNINTAGIAELDLLPGVGPVTAQKIIDYRLQIGRFTSVEQLDDVKGIGPKKLETMRPFVKL